jgi:type I restriction enzyme M protein
MEELEEIDYHLNISRYVSTAPPEVMIDLGEVHKELVAAEKEISKARERHNGFLAELGLDPLP